MGQSTDRKYRNFARLSLVTLIAVYFLILVGGIVRSTGSGMGCPDWPKCFGQWVPPATVQELPEDYKEIYAQKRDRKNQRFANYLQSIGFDNTAQQIRDDKTILIEADFNSFKTWTEYINRLIGVVIGGLILLTFLRSISFLKHHRKIFFIALAALLLVILQGWIGSIVVSTNLLTWTITVHMLLALGIVVLLILLYTSARKIQTVGRNEHHVLSGPLKWVILLCLISILVQIILGTQVREAIDGIAEALGYTMRGTWVAKIGATFLVHRSFSWLVFGLHIILLYLLRKSVMPIEVQRWGIALFGVLLLSILTGVVLMYWSFPAFAQPIHLLLATTIFGLQIFLIVEIKSKKIKDINN